jgi:ribosome-associated protein
MSIAVTDAIRLDEDELEISFIRSSGPGGQNVNKVSTAAQLRFDLLNSPNLSAPVKARAAKLAGSRLTQDGEIVITASTQRSQVQNREEAVTRLLEILRAAAIAPKRRVATRPTLASKRRRVDEKTQRGAVKRLRGSRPAAE